MAFKIIVCAKQVPDTNEVKIDPKKGTLIRDGVPSIINPDDKYAIEAAVTLKEKHGGEVKVVTMGPPQAETALREARYPFRAEQDRGRSLLSVSFSEPPFLL